MAEEENGRVVKSNAWSRQIRKETEEWKGKKTKNWEGGWGKQGKQRGMTAHDKICSNGITWLNFVLGKLACKNDQNHI